MQPALERLLGVIQRTPVLEPNRQDVTNAERKHI